MTIALAATFADVASALAFAALVLPVAILARRHVAGRGDPAHAVATGIAAVTVVLVAGGLLLSALGGLEAAGWLAIVVAADALLLVEARGRPRLLAPIVLAAAALALSAGAIALSRASAVDQERRAAFTQLWLVPRGDAAEVGVRNEEGADATYRLEVVGPPSDGARVLIERTLRLSDSQAWSGRLVLPPTAVPEQVTAELFRPGDALPYRRAHLWTPVTP